jgi:hypothetical protein
VAEVAVPVIAIGYEPGATAGPTLKVRLEEPPAVTEAGTKPAVTPAGRPDAESAIDSADPETRLVETVAELLLPAETETVVGEAEIEKSFGGGAAETVNETGVLCVAESAVPVTVIG